MIPTDLSSFFFQQIREAEERVDKIYEAVIGIVVDNKDIDKLARVKVKLPTISEDATWWAPLAALGGGKQRGWFFLPEIDDEVLVMFEHGEIGRPVIIGALWGGKDKPPDKNGGANEHRVIVSRAGSKIILDDDKGLITISDGGGIGVITISTQNKITIEAKQGDVCIQAVDDALTIVANDIDLKANANLHIESGKGIDLGGDGAVTIKGSAQLQIFAQGIDINQSGASAPQAGSASPQDIPDPIA
jgi:uncharacterized protein involved in type VI secretion and phage assembly